MSQTIPVPAEYHLVDVDPHKQDSFPWVPDCQACELRKDMVERPMLSARDDGWLQSALADIEHHFWSWHNIEIRVDAGSSKLGELQPLSGPYERTEWAVRLVIVADDSPIKGQLQFHTALNRRIAEAMMQIYLDRPDMFAHVALVSRVVVVTEYQEPGGDAGN